MRRLVKMMTVAAVLAVPAAGRADNTTAANADFVMLGEVRVTSLSNTVATRWFTVNLVSGRSYSASAWAPTADPSETPVNLAVAWFLEDGTTAAPGTDNVLREPSPVTTDHEGDAASIIPTGCAIATGCPYRVSVTASGATALFTVNLMIVETTMVSPYWQVAVSAGYDAAPQIRNNTSTSIPVIFTAYGSNGLVICSNTINIPANGMATFGISQGPPGCNIGNGFGSSQIAYHGPPGSIAANITTWSGLSGLSFDSPFYPRNTWTNLGTN